MESFYYQSLIKFILVKLYFFTQNLIKLMNEQNYSREFFNFVEQIVFADSTFDCNIESIKYYRCDCIDRFALTNFFIYL